jgi:hypothetical protein
VRFFLKIDLREKATFEAMAILRHVSSLVLNENGKVNDTYFAALVVSSVPMVLTLRLPRVEAKATP